MDTRARCVSRAMPGGVRCVVTAAGIVLTVAGILLLLVAGTAYAHAPQAGTTYEDAYSSIFPHARSTSSAHEFASRVQLHGDGLQ